LDPSDKEAESVEWADASWLAQTSPEAGRATAPMILSNSNVYAGFSGWGLVRFGAGR
jgi:hypothetical protein